MVAAEGQRLSHELRLQRFHEPREGFEITAPRERDQVSVLFGRGGGHAVLHLNGAP